MSIDLTFLGGINVGASCTLLRIGDTTLLVDAGVRVQQGTDPLPDLSLLQHTSIDAVLVTHAHADHIGALPVINQLSPATPILASRATATLMDVMLHDALNVMQQRARTEQTVPLYQEQDVQATLAQVVPIPAGRRMRLPFDSTIELMTALAGHVAGALSFGIQSPHGRIILSGDISTVAGTTIPAAAFPDLRAPDLLVLESTYGARMHPNRQVEERRLAEDVAAVIEAGGHVLIPAFALGRAQEVIRILRMAMDQRRIPRFPIWVDGLIRRICAAYMAFPEFLAPGLSTLIRRRQDPFYTTNIQAVQSDKQRRSLIQGPPSCIVASSGMLTGGPSVTYARALAESPQHAIFFSGYLDDESPGRFLERLADAPPDQRTLTLDGSTILVRCQVHRYHLSAHADQRQLRAYVDAVQPHQVALVHGDPGARRSLATVLERHTHVLHPDVGDTLTIESKSKRKRSRLRSVTVPTQGMGGNTPLRTEDLERLWYALVRNDRHAEQIVDVREVLVAWYGLEHAQWHEETRVLLQQHGAPYFSLFVRDGYTFVRIASEATVKEQQEERHLLPGMLVLVTIDDTWMPALCLDTTGLVEVMIADTEAPYQRLEESHIGDILGVWPDFPIEHRRTAIQRLRDTEKAARQWQQQNPLRAIIRVFLGDQEHLSFSQIADRLDIESTDLVGRLGLARSLVQHPEIVVRNAISPHQGHYRLAAAYDDLVARLDRRPDQQALHLSLDRLFGDAPDLYRRRIDPETGAVTLQFHFPDVARDRYANELETATATLGVPVRVHPNAHTQALSREATRATPNHLEIVKVSTFQQSARVQVQYRGTLTAAEEETAQQQFRTTTGWELSFLDVEDDDDIETPAPADLEKPGLSEPRTASRWEQNRALHRVREALAHDPQCYRIGLSSDHQAVVVRFLFPRQAERRHEATLRQLAEETGWEVRLHQNQNEQALTTYVQSLLPENVFMIGNPTFHQKSGQCVVHYRGPLSDDAKQRIQQQIASASDGEWGIIFQAEG